MIDGFYVSIDRSRYGKPDPRRQGRDVLSKLINIDAWRKAKKTVFFDRVELSALLSLYSERVAKGDWRDYAIDMEAGVAMFSVFRHAHEWPIYTIAKVVSPKRGQIDWELHYQARRLKRCNSVGDILQELRHEIGAG